jgi:hypothetical protein
MAKIVKNNGDDRMPIAAVLFLKTTIASVFLRATSVILCVYLPTPTHKKVPQ